MQRARRESFQELQLLLLLGREGERGSVALRSGYAELHDGIEYRSLQDCALREREILMARGRRP